ncbi:MAG: DHH family phosphoesterase [Bacilli bacterium]|nr:DHH family phosphoesterase [Bacilli bacterium]
MGKLLHRIRIVCFTIIAVEILAIALFSVFYFNDFFSLRTKADVTVVILSAFILVLIDCILIWLFTIRVGSLRSKTDLKAATIIGSDVQEAYNFAMIGLAVTDSSDTVLWTNDIFRQRHIDIIDKNIINWQPTLASLKENNGEEVAKIVVSNRNYDVKYLEDAGLWIFKDTTEYEAIYLYSKEQAPVVGLISIDNYEDVTRGEDDFNDVITRLKNAIFNYTQSFGVLMRRHRDDTYLILCNYDSFTKMKDDNFSILDKAREISKDEETPLTLSIGIAHDFPDVIKLNEMASNALDIAMSRGGDQAVITAYGSEMEFIGGKTEATEKRNRVKTRVLADSLMSLIKNASNVLIMGHTQMDMDALGAALGVNAICSRLAIKSRIVVDLKATESKTHSALLSQFSKDELDHLIVSPSNAEDQIEADTLLIVVDVHIPNMTMAPKLLDICSKVVVIDHHRRAEEYIESPVFNHIDSSASSASEIVTEFIRFCSLSPRIELPETYATIMLSGIFLDTGYFKNKRTGVRTFEASTILKEYGADNSTADDLLKDDYEEYIEINKLIKNMKTAEYGVVYAMGDNNTFYDHATIAKACNTLLTMKGVYAAFVFARVGNRSVRMSCRSSGFINVQILAEKLGGGGHFTSAAVMFEKDNVEEVEKELIGMLKVSLAEAQADAKSRKEIE